MTPGTTATTISGPCRRTARLPGQALSGSMLKGRQSRPNCRSLDFARDDKLMAMVLPKQLLSPNNQNINDGVTYPTAITQEPQTLTVSSRAKSRDLQFGQYSHDRYGASK